MFPVDGPHPRQDIRPQCHPAAVQNPRVLGVRPPLVGQGYVLLLDEVRDGRVLPVLIGDLVVDIVEDLAAALLHGEKKKC